MARTLDALINADEPAWPTVQGWLKQARHPVEVLDTVTRRGADVLLALQVTTRSPMGAIALQTGGLLIDHGWVRLLGGGCSRMEGDLARWNGLGPSPLVARFDGAMLVGHDVLGGFFALDGGALGAGDGAAYYLAPDTLEWERLADSYSALVAFLLTGDLAKFYGDHRWPGWETEVTAVPADQGFSFAPPLFAKEEADVPRSRRAVPMVELLGMNLDLQAQLLGEDAGE